MNFRSPGSFLPRGLPRSIAAVAASAVILAVFVGCEEEPVRERPVQGQIFVVSPDGQSIRLGSVEVLAFEERQVERFLDRASREIAERRAEATARLEEAKEDASGLRAAHAAAQEAHEARERALRDEVDRFVEEVEQKVQQRQQEIADNERLIEQVGTRPTPPQGVPSPQEYEEFAERRSRWFSMSAEEREAWAEVLVLANRELSADIEEVTENRDTQLARWKEELQRLDEAVEQLGQDAADASERVARLEGELEAIPQIEDYMAELPEPVLELRTDADGEFEGLLPEGRYALFARASRYLAGEVKEFHWFVWTDVGQRPNKVLLSNHNLLLSDAEESVLKRQVSKIESAGL